jgi:hypothetical protein
MAALLCPSPVILDQSFPRDDDELNLVAVALGELQLYIEEDKAHLIITNILRELVADFEGFDWTPPSRNKIQGEIYRLIQQVFLREHERIVQLDNYIDLFVEKEHLPHPVPKGCEKQGLVEIWSDELGIILVLHDQCCNKGEYFIGVACEHGFAGEPVGEYDNSTNTRAFPLVGPDNIIILADAYDWDTPKDIHQKPVSLHDAQKNIHVIGGTIARCDGDHFNVTFEGGRTWPLTLRDPVPPPFLDELVPITHYPLKVIKTALITGKLPRKILKFEKV